MAKGVTVLAEITNRTSHQGKEETQAIRSSRKDGVGLVIVGAHGGEGAERI